MKSKNKVMEFRFINGGFIDGINFNASCSGRLGFTVWEVTRDAATGKPVRDANGKVVRTRLPIYVGTTPTLVTAATVPALATNAPDDVSRVVILRTPVKPVKPVSPVPADPRTPAPDRFHGPWPRLAREGFRRGHGQSAVRVDERGGVPPRTQIQWVPPR